MLQDLVAQAGEISAGPPILQPAEAQRAGAGASRGGWLEALTSWWVLEFRGVGGADCAAGLSRDQGSLMIKRTVTVSITVVGLAAVLAAPAGALAAGARPAPGQCGARAHRATVYVVNIASNTVTPIRAATRTPCKAIKVGREPVAIAITPDGKPAYVVNSESGTVTPIRTRTNTVLTAIKVGRVPDDIAIAYVIDSGSDKVTPICTATNTALKAISVGQLPAAIAITPNGKTAYVANGTDSVTPIRIGTNTALKPINVGQGPEGIAITPGGKTVYVVSWFTDTVTPIRTSTNTPLKAINVGSQPDGIVITL
jgi:YVTN family beta-propeller protein